MRGRNRNKGPNPLTRTYESNGPDVKIRGTAQHVADKYAQLARDAQASGDPVAAENYLQHAEHYYRIIAAAQEQFREQFGGYQRPFEDDGDEESVPFGYGGPAERAMPGAGGDDLDIGSQPQPYEMRPENERPNRFDRGERQERGERPDRTDQRGEQRFDRGDRPDRGDRRERFPRHDRPRPEFQRDREDGQRPDYQPRFDRRDRRREEPEEAAANGLPAFLTTPVRTPIAMDESAGPSEAAPAETVNGEAVTGEVNGRYRQRRRRRPRFEGGEAGAETGADFAPARETPAE